MVLRISWWNSGGKVTSILTIERFISTFDSPSRLFLVRSLYESIVMMYLASSCTSSSRSAVEYNCSVYRHDYPLSLRFSRRNIVFAIVLRCYILFPPDSLLIQYSFPPFITFEAFTAVTIKNVVFWDIKIQFVLHRRHITSTLQSQAS
jgi:hypothetical protein